MTMNINGSFPVIIEVSNIARFVKLSGDDIVSTALETKASPLCKKEILPLFHGKSLEFIHSETHGSSSCYT